ncbi:MAG: hypothetical protein LBV61_09635 [Burkholderiaceae bacterium]|jgi:ubiquinone biosynthesis protein UbiJ|nr:hypothetical protein [Burkholderiaceae bacterium]
MIDSSSPLRHLNTLLSQIGKGLQPPAWFVREAQYRIVLFLNHVLQQEPQAQQRVARQQGRNVAVQWGALHMRLVGTPAGLLELAPEGTQADLTLSIQERSALDLAQTVLRGAKPAIQIVGDVQLAAEVNWLVDHVRWDAEEDLARLMGDVPAHAIGSAARRLAQALRRFTGQATQT